MRFFFQSAVAVCAVFLVLAAATGLAAEGEVAAAPVVTPAITASLGALFMQALASSAGVAVLAGILAWVLNWLFLAKPEWKVLYDKYQPAFMVAVKYAEKLIPDTTPDKSLARLDAALRKVVEIEAALNSVPTSVLTQVINMVHAEAEANGNIRKG